jgi:type I restriction enzyme, S subunit
MNQTNSQRKTTPKLRFPGFNNKWLIKELGNISDVRDGTHESPQYIKEGYPLVTSKNLLKDGALDLENVSCISVKDFENISRRSKVDLGDILFGMIGTIGNPVLVKKVGFAIKNVALIKELGEVSNSYLIYYLNSNSIQKQFYTDNTGGTQKFIALGTIRSLKIGITSKGEQQKIADFLTAVDEKISKMQKKVELLKKYKKGVMQKILSQKIRFKDVNGKDYPDWEKRQLSEILVIRNEKNTVKYEEVFSVAKKAGVVNQIEHLGRSFASADISNYKVIYEDDLVYTKSPTSDFPYGIIKQNKTNRNGIVSPLYGVYIPKNKYLSTILDYYFSFWVNTFNYLNPIVQKGAKNTINISDSGFLEGDPILLPIEEEEQEKIASFLNSYDVKINLEERRLGQAKRFKKSLLQQMFI